MSDGYLCIEHDQNTPTQIRIVVAATVSSSIVVNGQVAQVVAEVSDLAAGNLGIRLSLPRQFRTYPLVFDAAGL